MLKAGELAPEFILTDHNGRDIRLMDLDGKRAVLWFFPRVTAPGCAVESQSFVDRYDEFEQRDVVVLGISPDTVADAADFARKHEVPFSLLCDADLLVSMEYGAVESQDDGFAKRITYIIETDGSVLHVFRQVKPQNHAEEVLKILDANPVS